MIRSVSLTLHSSIYPSVHLSVRLPIYLCMSVSLSLYVPLSHRLRLHSWFLCLRIYFCCRFLLLIYVDGLSMCTRSTGIWRGVTCRRHAAIVSTTPGGPIKQRGTNLHSHPYCPQPWGPSAPKGWHVSWREEDFHLLSWKIYDAWWPKKATKLYLMHPAPI